MMRIQPTISQCLLVSTLLVTACNTQQAKLEKFSSETGQFTIATPATLEETQQSIQTPVGPVDIFTFTAESEESAYVVAYSDYPPAVIAQTEPELLLDSSRDGAVNNLGGTLVSEDKIELQGNPGRSLVISTNEASGESATINSRIYLVDNRLYQILVVTPTGQEKANRSQAFLDSFDLN